MLRTDVLIVGGGLAGRNAAAELREKFPRLQLLVCDAGGCASTEIMGLCAPVKPGDSAQCFRDDILRAAAGLASPELAQTLVEHAVSEKRRLERLGIAFDRAEDASYATLHSIGSSFPRVVHSGTTTGEQAMALLAVPIKKCRIIRLLRDAKGRIVGGVTDADEEIRAKAVILAGGGFAGLWSFSTWSKSLRGDTLALAQEAGATLCNLECVQFEPTVAVFPQAAYAFPVITTMLHEGARLYGRDGVDLCADGIPAKRELAIRIQRCIDAGNAWEHGGVRYDFTGVDEEKFRANYPEYHHKYRQWFPSFAELRFEVRPAAHTTLGGIRIAPDCSTGVAGLFAAGECVGNLYGRDRLGGCAGLEVFVFGRIAGATAGEYAATAPEPLPVPDPRARSITDSAQITAILDRYFSVIPKQAAYRSALRELAALPDTNPTVLFLRQMFTAAIKTMPTDKNLEDKS
jgi:aspartate oxidase